MQKQETDRNITGIPGVFFVHIQVADIEPVYFTLMVNFLFIGAAAYLIVVVLSSVIFGAGYIFGVLNQPLLVIVSKVVWTIDMGMFFGMVYKKTKNLWLPIMFHFMINVCALPYCFSSINGYADLTLYIVVPVYIILGIYSFIELKKKREISVVG